MQLHFVHQVHELLSLLKLKKPKQKYLFMYQAHAYFSTYFVAKQ